MIAMMQDHRWLLGAAAGLSILLFAGTLIGVPVAIVRMRPD